MPFDGSGNYTPAPAPNFPAVGGTVINAAYYNAVINDIASALSNTLTRDGQGKPTAAINWNGKNLTNVATFGAVDAAFSAGVVITGGLTIGSTLAVTGATTLAAVSATTGAFSGALTGTTAAFSGNVTIGGTLDLAAPLPVGEGGTGVTTATGTGSTVRNTNPSFVDTITIQGQGAGLEGGQLGLNKPDNSTLAYIFDVDSGGHGRLFTTANNTNLSLGQLAGTGGIVTLHTAANERVRVDAAGNVGIGTAGPNDRLHIVGGGMLVSDGTSTNQITNSGGVGLMGTISNHPLAFQTNNAERARITTGGAFAVGAAGTEFGRSWRFIAKNDVAGRAEFGFVNSDTGAASGVNIARITGVGNSFCDWELTNNGGSPLDNFSYGSGVAAVRWLFNAAVRFQLNASGSITSTDIPDAVGFKGVPASATTSGTLTRSELGRCLPLTGGATINTGVFGAGDSFSLYNNSGSAITITQGAGFTLRLAGTATTGNRTLAARGLATIWFISGTEAVISGGGLT